VNPKQSDESEGFAELLEVAGFLLTWGGIAFTALIRTLQPSSEKFDLSVGDDDAVQVRAFASAFPNGLPTVGVAFEDILGTLYRVRRVIRPPSTPIITFECEVSHP